jgi:hypothetical protein
MYRGLPLPGLSGGLPLAIEGAIVTRAAIEDVSEEGWALYLDTVEVKGSNIPGLRQVRRMFFLPVSFRVNFGTPCKDGLALYLDTIEVVRINLTHNWGTTTEGPIYQG